MRDATVSVSGQVAPGDYDALDEQVTRTVEEVFGAGGADVHRSSLSASYTLPRGEGLPAEGLTVFGSFDGLEEHAELVTGEWPAGAGGEEVEAALSEPAARALGLAQGDVIEVTSVQDEDETIACARGRRVPGDLGGRSVLVGLAARDRRARGVAASRRTGRSSCRRRPSRRSPPTGPRRAGAQSRTPPESASTTSPASARGWPGSRTACTPKAAPPPGWPCSRASATSSGGPTGRCSSRAPACSSRPSSWPCSPARRCSSSPACSPSAGASRRRSSAPAARARERSASSHCAKAPCWPSPRSWPRPGSRPSR